MDSPGQNSDAAGEINHLTGQELSIDSPDPDVMTTVKQAETNDVLDAETDLSLSVEFDDGVDHVLSWLQ